MWTSLSRFSMAFIMQEIRIPVVSGLTADVEKSMSCIGFCAYCRVGARALLRANVVHRFQENCAFIEDIDDFPVTFQRQAAPSKPPSQFTLQVTFTGSRESHLRRQGCSSCARVCAIASVLLRFLRKLPQSFPVPMERRGYILIAAQPGGSSLPKMHCVVLSWMFQQRFRVGNHSVLQQFAAATGDWCRPRTLSSPTIWCVRK